jgi:demethylspheroidene O-methyltransferase
MASPPWRERLIEPRNRLLSNPKFQQWAAGFPLTRGVARRRAEGLFDLVAGFVYAQTLTACVRLGLLPMLAEAPMTAAAAAARLDIPLDGAERLLGAAAALALAEPLADGRYALGAQGAALLGQPGLTAMIEHHLGLYDDLADPVRLLREGRGALADYWPYATAAAPTGVSAEAAAPYSALMAATQPAVGAGILAAYPVSRHRRLLDVGGGEGAFLEAAGAATPKPTLMLFDLPAVTERARIRLQNAGLLSRVSLHAGDFLADPIPSGADLITLIRVLHDHDEAGVLSLLSRIRAALPPTGALLIAEPMAGGSAAGRVSDVYFAFYLLSMGRGRARSPEDLTRLLRMAGFSRVRPLKTRTPFLLRILLARP